MEHHRPRQGKEKGDSGDSLPLLAAVERYLCSPPGAPPLRMHVPGHKGGPGAPPALVARWGREVFGDDLTEVPGLDDLSAPADAIARSQASSAARLGATALHYLVQGTTGGLTALMLALARTCGGHGRVLLPRHSHRALVACIILSGLDPEFVPARFEGGLPCGPDIDHLRRALECPGPSAAPVVAVFDTYPTIHGVAHDLAKVAGVCRQHALPLLVDGAHSGLFGLDPVMPVAPLALGADAVVVSAHKTMGSLGQSSLLLLGSGKKSFEAELRPALRLVHTTSPSYPLLLSLEAAVEHATGAVGRSLARTAAETGAFVRTGLARHGITCWEPPGGSGLALDPMRVTVDAATLGLTGFSLASLLRDRAGVQVEGADWRNLLVVLGPGDGPREGSRLLDAIASVLSDISIKPSPVQHEATSARLSCLYERLFTGPFDRALLPRTAWLAGRETVPLHEAAGRIAAEPIAPYPPGVPVVWPGEALSGHAVEFVSGILGMGGSVHGLDIAAAGPHEGAAQVLVLRGSEG